MKYACEAKIISSRSFHTDQQLLPNCSTVVKFSHGIWMTAYVFGVLVHSNNGFNSSTVMVKQIQSLWNGKSHTLATKFKKQLKLWAWYSFRYWSEQHDIRMNWRHYNKRHLFLLKFSHEVRIPPGWWAGWATPGWWAGWATPNNQPHPPPPNKPIPPNGVFTQNFGHNTTTKNIYSCR